MVARRIDIRNARVHLAARMIAYWVKQGGFDKWSAFIAPPIKDNPIFNYWFDTPEQAVVLDTHALVACALAMWPVDKVHYFHAYPITQLFARHNSFERSMILHILKDVYGFPFQFPTA